MHIVISWIVHKLSCNAAPLSQQGIPLELMQMYCPVQEPSYKGPNEFSGWCCFSGPCPHTYLLKFLSDCDPVWIGLCNAQIYKLADATSYEERATLRQVMRKRKKERGEPTARSKARGNSVYNRFAGSTGTKSPAKNIVVKSVSVFISSFGSCYIANYWSSMLLPNLFTGAAQ